MDVASQRIIVHQVSHAVNGFPPVCVGESREMLMYSGRVLRNVLSNYALTAVGGVIGFILTPILFHSLHPQNYAILIFALNAVAIMQGIELGLFSTLVRFVSNLAAQQKFQELQCLASSGFFLLSGLGIFGAVTLLSLSPWLARYFRVGGSAGAPGALVLALLGLSLVFQLSSSGVRAFLEGCQEFQRANAVDIAMQLFWVAGTLLLLRGGFGLLAIAVLYPAMSLLRLVGMLLAARYATIAFRPRLVNVNFKILGEIRHFASLIFVGENAILGFFRLDAFLAARLLPLPELAILGVARKIPWALRDLSLQPLSVAYPMLSSADARGDRQMMQHFFFLSARNLLALTLPLAAGLYVWTEPLLRLWVGQEVLTGVPVFRIYLIFAIFASLEEIPLYLLYGMGRIQLNTARSVIMLAVAIPAGAWACWRGGLWGLAVVFAAIQAAGTVVLFFQAVRLAEVDVGRWVNKAIVPPVLAVLPTATWFWISYPWLPHTLVGLSFSAISGSLLFTAIFVGLTTGTEKLAWRVRVKRLLTEIE
jgi:O-antigen/teichoic acid export membrane protein